MGQPTSQFLHPPSVISYPPLAHHPLILDGYIIYTKKTALKRKRFMQSQHKYDKIADFLINESMQNFFAVKSNSTEKYEKTKYTTSLKSYIDNFGQSQKYLAMLN